MYIFYYKLFIIFYDPYLEILRLKIYFENRVKSNRKKQKRTEEVSIFTSQLQSSIIIKKYLLLLTIKLVHTTRLQEY